ncbi:MAG: Lrp/AsnC family transcriptional regulator [Pseudomonadota bacterium]
MDAVDEKILRELSKEGRLSNAGLADRVGLSASACLRRVQELERRKVITGYRATLDRAALGTGFTAYVTVGLSDHSKPAQEAFERAVSRLADVRECHNITGDREYLLRVETSDLESYKRFHTDHLGMIPGVAAITTMVVMGSPKDERA